MAPVPAESPLAHSTLYERYIPNIMIAVAFVYGCVVLFRYINRLYRRIQRQAVKQEQELLYLLWEKMLAIKVDDKAEEEEKQNIGRVRSSDTTSAAYSSQYGSATTLVSHNARINMNIQQKRSKRSLRSYLLLHNKKRRRLAWEWSASLRICRYEHAIQMNSLVEMAEKDIREEKHLVKAGHFQDFSLEALK